MDFAIFNMEGVAFLLRWLHIFFGIIWIGHLYYFNFVQGAFFNETDASTKSNAIQKLVPRALWWFRWGAMWTFVTGLLLFGLYQGQGMVLASAWGVQIGLGMSLATLMWANVWFIIWPNQKIVIQSATQAASGGQALPQAAAAGAKALLASRTNVFFSIPMLFLMASARHLSVASSETSSYLLAYLIPLLVVLGFEANALKGKLGILTTVKGVLTSGFVALLGFYVWIEFTL